MKNTQNLTNKTIAILATDGVEQIELTSPRDVLHDAGAETVLISIKNGEIKAWNNKDWGESFFVDLHIDQASAKDFDGLLLPGGVMNPDKLRMNEQAVTFVKEFFQAKKPVAAICHGPWLLAEAKVVQDRTITGYPSIQTDLVNAGAIWVDKEVVVDQGLVTSRNPDDLPEFNHKMVEEFSEGIHE